MSAADTARQPTRYELSGDKLELTYSTTSLTGAPLLSYRSGTEDRQFTGDEIRISASQLGTLVTVVLRTIPDLETVTFTLAIPNVNLGDAGSAPIATFAVTTVRKTSIAGPPQGQVDHYTVHQLQGTASFVVS